jgi:hypothetical protein
MWFWPVNEMFELVSDASMSLQGRISVSAKNRAGSRLKRLTVFVLIDVKPQHSRKKRTNGIAIVTGPRY